MKNARSLTAKEQVLVEKAGRIYPFIFDRNYQCLLDHEVFQMVRQVLPSPNFVRNIVGLASASPPRLFPDFTRRDTNQCSKMQAEKKRPLSTI